MGQFEKIVVLAVLFTITVIVVISLSTGEDGSIPSPLAGLDPQGPALAAFETTGPAGAGTPAREGLPRARPLASAARPPLGTDPAPRSEFSFDEPAAGGWSELASAAPGSPAIDMGGAGIDPTGQDLGPPATGAEPGPTRATDLRGRFLLSTEVEDPQAPPAGLPAGTILRTGAGLEPTPHPDFMAYTLRPGDTYSGLAERFYGASSRLSLLRQANEGRRELRAGEAILVPIHDLGAEVPGRPERPQRTERAAGTTASPSAAGAVTYEVQPGESLWAIAKKHYGTGVRWPEIFEANQGLMRDPDALQAGMRLRIP